VPVNPHGSVARAGRAVNTAMIASAGAMRRRARRKGERRIGFATDRVFIFFVLIVVEVIPFTAINEKERSKCSSELRFFGKAFRVQKISVGDRLPSRAYG
jgi:hypothetical protein